MNGFLHHLLISLRLNFRNKQAIVFGYLVPIFFLIAYAAFFRAQKPPLVRQLSQVLAISIMGGACFGMPITFVTERERGLWRRYRLVPMRTGWFVASMVLSRYLLIISSALIQIGIAMWAYKMPAPHAPWKLLGAFTCASFAFVGVGLVISMLASSTGAVQAMGQCIFLPMMIIGGVGIPLDQANIPPWMRKAAMFGPGKYAVDAMRFCIENAKRLPPHYWYSFAALVVIGAAGCLAAAKLFRWENSQRPALSTLPWVLAALAAWAAVGIGAQILKLV